MTYQMNEEYIYSNGGKRQFRINYIYIKDHHHLPTAVDVPENAFFQVT